MQMSELFNTKFEFKTLFKNEQIATHALEMSKFVDSDSKNIKSVKFNLNIDGSCVKTLYFLDKPVTELYAISEVEAYLSKPLSEIYYYTTNKKILIPEYDEIIKSGYKIRGDLLKNKIILNGTETRYGHLTIHCVEN